MIRLLAPLMTLALTATACASLSGIAQSPKAELERVDVKDAGLTSATAVFVLNVENPNKIPLHLDKVDYELFLDNHSFGQSSIDQNLDLPAEGKARIQIPLPITYAKLGDSVKKILLGQDLDYRLAGHAHLSLLSLPFEKSGKLQIREALGK